jgi:PatG Domain
MSDHAGCGCEGECTCGKSGSAAPAFSPFVYAIGTIPPVAASVALEKEVAQTLGRALTTETDFAKLRGLLSKRENRYLVRNLRWVLQIDGADAYVLMPSDPADFELLLDAVEATRPGESMNLVVGLRAAGGGLGDVRCACFCT